MNWLRKLFSPKPQPDPWATFYAAKWQLYQDWCNEQTCIGCGKAFRDRAKGEKWMTEECCLPCAEGGAETRRDPTVRF